MVQQNEETPALYWGEARRIIEEIREDDLIRPVMGQVVYESCIAQEWPHFPLSEFIDILADNLFDWRGSTQEFLRDIPMSEADLAEQERQTILNAGQMRLFDGNS